jgi:hypothetical protein
MSKRALAVPALLALLLPAGARATTSLSLDRGGAIGGAPGETVGWGYTLVNDTNYLVVTRADFIPEKSGSFSDFIAALDLRVVGPPPESSSVQEPFDAATSSGIGSFAISPAAMPGTSAIGQIVLTYDLYTVSPNDPGFDPLVHTVSLGNLLGADASVFVSALDDADADGTSDALDNCPFHPSGRLTDTDSDGRGNDCECGDQNGDGANTVSDLVAINLVIFNPTLLTPLCDASGDGRCDVSDIIAANVEIFSPGNTSTCARQPVPGP